MALAVVKDGFNVGEGYDEVFEKEVLKDQVLSGTRPGCFKPQF
jgi:hypothetical protein